MIITHSGVHVVEPKFWRVEKHSGMLTHLRSGVYALTVSLILLSLFSSLSRKLAKNLTLLLIHYNFDL